MNADQINNIANTLRQQGQDVSAGDVALVLANMDLTPIIDANSQRVQWSLWDKVSDINGVEPEYFLGRDDYAGGEVYLIEVDGRVVIVQPHDPEQEGTVPIAEGESSRLAEAQRQLMVDDLVFRAVLGAVTAALPESATVMPVSSPTPLITQPADVPSAAVPGVNTVERTSAAGTVRLSRGQMRKLAREEEART